MWTSAPTPRFLRRLTPLALAAGLSVALFPAASTVFAQDVAEAPAKAAAAWTLEDEFWYTLEIAGARTGYMHVRSETDGSDIRTSTTTRIKIDRGPASVEIVMSSESIEAVDGGMKTCTMSQDMGQQPVRTTYVFTDGEVEMTTRQGGRVITKSLPLPAGDWMTPNQAAAYFAEQAKQGADKISYRALMPEAGLEPVEVTHVRMDTGERKVGERSIPVTIWKSTNTMIPVPSTDAYDADGVLVHQEMMMAGLGRMVTSQATRELALAEVDAAPELLFSTFITPSRPIDDVMRATDAVFTLRVNEGEMPELPSTGAQTFTKNPDGTATLTVNTLEPLPAASEEQVDERYLDSSTYCDLDDPMLKKLAARAVKSADENDDMARAEAIRAFVFRYITAKGYATAFATASETARTRSGDCSEHGVLTCALLRANGIPARVASGLVYADGLTGGKPIFGWHMWTQALVDGAWIDLDATLPVRYNAGHVLTGVAALEDGTSIDRDMANILMLMGNLEVDVVEVGHRKKGEARTPAR